MQPLTSWTASSADIIPDTQDLSALAGRWNEAVDVHVSSPFRVTYGSLHIQSPPRDPQPVVEGPMVLR